MRIEIKTPKPVKDRDIKALYVLKYALTVLSTERMRKANIRFVLQSLGIE